MGSKPVNDATIRRDLAFLSSLFSMAIRWEWVDTNPITAVGKRSLKESRPRTRFLTRAEFSVLKRAAPDFLKPMLVLAVETGMRREELLSVTPRRRPSGAALPKMSGRSPVDPDHCD